MKTKRRSFIATSALAGAMLAGTLVAPQPALADDMRMLRFGDFGPNRGTRAEAMKWIDTELRARSGGKLGIEFIWGGALLGAKTAIDGIADGVADMGSIVPVYAPGKLVTYELADAYQYGDEWVGQSAVYELMTTNETIKKEWDNSGLVYFANYTTGPTQLLSKKPVKSVADLKGMTVRATGSFVSAFKDSGASTVSLGQPKVYEALSNGTVDGSTTYYYVIKAYKHYELIDHVTELNMGQYLPFGIAMNKGTFESLSPEHQKLMAGLGKDFTQRFAQIMWQARQDVKAEIQKGIDGHKMTVHTPGDDLVPALASGNDAHTQKWVAKAKKKNLPADDLLAAYKTLIDKYSAELADKGYPWK